VSRPVVRSIVFDDDGATVEFALPEDVRSNGLVLNRVIRIPFGPEWGLELEACLNAIEDLLVDVLEDFGSATPRAVPESAEDGDEDEDEDEDDQA
jgi:hypothetical protein